ncbi:MAG: PTS IIA-like nitrogen regulatory protein PtsN [Alphaproteobacteria bacterium]|nr:PTS IIA-like nitrogen regulatory protein PtsN [Alphaproteobacteria bacterium]MDX5369435.1 PTS IIA-like nitrogen regulatory protein PtsN [Alphaproteobacteria bacterium]MDX5464115.1 PTS IIA-like nitrogen regulatory protein PtsN [Alphaproteobacteria bacterium]
MELHELVLPEAVLPALKVSSKKQALEALAAKAAELTGLGERDIFETLLGRERLGTTGVGQGVAIPHGKLDGLERVWGVFARLDQPIDFDSIDEQPVDLVFLLLAPTGAGADHLKALARVSRLLRNKVICAKVRGSRDADAIHALLTEASTASNAA